MLKKRATVKLRKYPRTSSHHHSKCHQASTLYLFVFYLHCWCELQYIRLEREISFLYA